MRQDGRRQTVCSAAMATSSMIFLFPYSYKMHITYELKVPIEFTSRQLHLFSVILIQTIPIF